MSQSSFTDFSGAGGTAPTLHADLEHLSFDSKLTGKIMAKRQAEMARRSRILDPRKRQYGVSHDVLDNQVAEKRDAAQATAAEDEYYTKATILQEQVAQVCETLKAKGTRERHKAVIEFSQKNLLKDTRREYALSDPNELKKERMLTEEEMAQYGPSSMMSLGETPEAQHAKTKAKQAQTRSWLMDQMKEKEERFAAERAIDLKHDQDMMLANQVRAVAEKAAKEEAREEKLQEVADNFVIADKHRQRYENKLNKNIMANTRHVDSINSDPVLLEQHDHVYGSNGKLLKHGFRRMSQDQYQDLWNQNAGLVMEKNNRKAAEKYDNKDEMALATRASEVLQVVENEKVRMVKDRRVAAEEHNQVLAAQKRERDMHEMRTYKSFSHLG